MRRSHTMRFGRSDEVLTPGWLTRPGHTRDRFMAKVQGRGQNECWLWMAGVDRYGYGKFSLYGKYRGAHRVAYEGTHGPIPDGLTLDHLCRNRACVNPMHLDAVPHKVNVNRGLRKLKHHEIVQQIVQWKSQVHANNDKVWCGRGDLNPQIPHINHNKSVL